MLDEQFEFQVLLSLKSYMVSTHECEDAKKIEKNIKSLIVLKSLKSYTSFNLLNKI